MPTMLSAPPDPRRLTLRRPQRRVVALLAMLSVTAVACAGGAAAEPQVASLDSVATAAATETSVDAADSQEALLAYAACMRENGIDMADPTFDADGNAQGGLGFGPDSGIDPRSDEFQTAQTACGDLIEGITFGGRGQGGQGGGFDIDALQTASADFTACLRDEGLEVDDLTIGGGPGGGDGRAPDGSLPATGGSVPEGGFEGGPPPDGGAGGPGGDGFDPTARLVEQLGLDADDPAVSAALEVCQPILEAAFQPADGTTDTTGDG
jgi:hypothetical protein